MCGLFGYVGLKGADMQKIKMLATANDTRGGDASGIYSPEFGIIKSKGLGYNLIPNSIKRKSPEIIIGHTRLATHGINCNENAHPFKVGKLVGAHNGVISNYKSVAETYGHKPHAVDSVAIFQALSSVDKSKWAETLPEIHGSMAISVVDSDGLNLYRRDNPIYIGKADKGIYYSSIKTSLDTIACDNIEAMPLNEIHVYDKNGIKSVSNVAPYVGYAESWEDYIDSKWGEFDMEELTDIELYDIVESELSLQGMEAFRTLIDRMYFYRD